MPGTPAQNRPTLRLVGDQPEPAPRRSRADVARENTLAAGLSPLDARWLFAVNVASAIEGGKAAVLPPEKRQRLVASAVQLGLRPFDANLVIAVVQEAAREGVPLSRETQERLVFVRPTSTEDPSDIWIRLVIALTLAGLLLFLAADWLNA